MGIIETLKGMGNIVIYYPSIARALGNVNAAILICQFVFYTNKAPDEEVFLSHGKIKDTTGLTRTQLEGARKLLVELGILEVFRKGLPAKNAYKVNWAVMNEIMQKHLIAENPQSSQLDCGEPTTVIAENPEDLFAGNKQTNTDTRYIEDSDDTLVKKQKETEKQIFLTKNYKPCTDLFFEFYKNTLLLPPPKFDGSEGKALKTIIIYFRDNLPPDDEMRAQNALKFIFEKWKILPKFYQEQITLKQINSRLLQIINEIKKLSTGETKQNGLQNLRNYADQVRADQ